MKKITFCEFKDITIKTSEYVEKELEKLQSFKQETPLRIDLDRYLSSRAGLADLFKSDEDELSIIKKLLKSLDLADKALIEQNKSNSTFINQYEKTVEKAHELSSHLTFITDIVTNSLERNVEKLHIQKSKGGRNGRKYGKHEDAIKAVLKKLVHKNYEKFTQQMALDEIENTIKKNSGDIIMVNIDTLKMWLRNYKTSQGETIFKL